MADTATPKNNHNANSIKSPLQQFDIPTFILQEATIEEVMTSSTHFFQKCAGENEISSKFLETCTQELARPLTFLINKSF